MDSIHAEVTAIIVARNARTALPCALTSLVEQDMDPRLIEVVLVDNCSEDETLAIMEQFSKSYSSHFLSIKIIHNSDTSLASGWNRAIQESTGAFCIRFDAHAALCPSYIRAGHVYLSRSQKNVAGVGGWLEHRGKGIFGGAVASFYTNRFGGGAALYRRRPSAVIRTDTVVFAMYRKDYILTVGGFDESLDRNQDIDLHRRLSELGLEFHTHPEMVADYFVRPRLSALLKKAFVDGLWVVRAPGRKLRHLAPLFFVLGMVIAFMASLIFEEWTLFLIVGLIYSVVFFVGARFYSGKKLLHDLISLPVGFMYHISYGVGSVAALMESFGRANGDSRRKICLP